MNIFREYIKLVLEAKFREADVSGGGRVPFVSAQHAEDLQKRITDLTFWRDKEKKGSENRANYTRIIQKLKGKLKKAQSQVG